MKKFRPFATVLLISVILFSCKKNDSEELKDFSYFKEIMKTDNNIIAIKTLINEKINLKSQPFSVYSQPSSIKLFIAEEFSKDKMEARANKMAHHFKMFIEQNPQFNNLTEIQKIDLLQNSIKPIEDSNEFNLSLNLVSSGDCMGGFSYMANVCAHNYDMDCIGSFMGDPLDWPLNILKAENSYRNCLDDSCDVMLVCQTGQIVN